MTAREGQWKTLPARIAPTIHMFYCTPDPLAMLLPPAPLAIRRKFWSACNRVSMSAISALASSNSADLEFVRGSADVPAAPPATTPADGCWLPTPTALDELADARDPAMSSEVLLLLVTNSLSFFFTSCNARPGDCARSADCGRLPGRLPAPPTRPLGPVPALPLMGGNLDQPPPVSL